MRGGETARVFVLYYGGLDLFLEREECFRLNANSLLKVGVCSMKRFISCAMLVVFVAVTLCASTTQAQTLPRTSDNRPVTTSPNPSKPWRTAFNAGGNAVYLPNGVGEVKGIDGPCVAGMALKFIFVLSGGSRCLHLAI